MLNFRQIRIFLAVYEAGSFSRAAEREHATQSGLSMQIRKLEDALRIRLFARTPSGVIPTQAGERLYHRSIDILRRLHEAETDIAALVDDVSGAIRIGLMPAFTLGVLAPALTRFIVRFPRVDVTVIEGFSPALIEGTEKGQFDFAIVPAARLAPGVTGSHFGSDREILVTGKDSPLRHLHPASLAELGPLKLVLPTHGNARRERLDLFFSLHGIKVARILEIDAMSATLDFVADSDFMTILPATICARDFEGDVRKLHPIASPALSVDYMLIEASRRPLSPTARLFHEALAEQFRRIHALWDAVLPPPGPAA